MSLNDPPADAQVWQKAIRKLRGPFAADA